MKHNNQQHTNISNTPENNFCRRCGSALKDQNGVLKCARGHAIFPTATPCVGMFLFESMGSSEAYLSVRGIDPRRGELDCFGGFVDYGENLEEALAREMKEETGLDTSDYSKPVYFCSSVSDYEFQGESRQVLSSFFYAYKRTDAIPVASDDVASVIKLDLLDFDFSMTSAQDFTNGVRSLQQILKEVL